MYRLLLRRRVLRAVGQACSNSFKVLCLCVNFSRCNAVYVFVIKKYDVIISCAYSALAVKDKVVTFDGGMVFSRIFSLFIGLKCCARTLFVSH